MRLTYGPLKGAIMKFMKFGCGLFAAVFALFGAMSVSADSVPPDDPRILVGHGGTSLGVGFQFTVKVKGGGGVSDFFNDTTSTWTELIFTGDSKTPQSVQCLIDPVLFFGCSVSSQSLNPSKFEVTITYFGPPGIAPGEHFIVDLNGGKGLWQSAFLAAQAVTAPEPSSLAFCWAGLFIIPVWLKRRHRPQ
jgi:hypothetical protein